VVCLDKPADRFLSGIPCQVHPLGQTFLGRFAFSPRLWKWLHENAGRFDGIVMNGIWTFPGLAVRAAARRSGTPYAVFVHGALDPWFNREYPLKYFKKLLYWPVQHAVLHDAKAVFFTSKIEQDLANSSFRPNHWNSVIVPYGTLDPDLAGCDPAGQVEEFYRKVPELGRRRYLLFLARIHEKKGCDLLLEAFAQLADMAPEVDLVIAGPDQVGMQAKLMGRAEKLGIARRVHWPGMLSGDIKWGALRACDAFILPSHQENFGISVAEALAVGRPVLISNQVNIWPEIENDGVGLVDDDTLEGTVRLLRCWFELPAAKRNEMTARARPCFKERFAMRRTAAVINSSFASVSPAGLAR
jgi:glycosyltransferase involved in cell wall biosynthesis